MSLVEMDLDRLARCGHIEAVFAPGKSDDALVEAVSQAIDGPLLVTRATEAQARRLTDRFGTLVWAPQSRCVHSPLPTPSHGEVAIITAGSSDIAVAEEAALTCALHGIGVRRIFDVGVAGIHRTLKRIDAIREARIVIVVAGMDGALPSVIGGLVDTPVIAVPTSVGYGASFGGVSALLAMLNACAAGVSVVNIDNGFGAAIAATRMRGLLAPLETEAP